jgi:hypothetical protein
MVDSDEMRPPASKSELSYQIIILVSRNPIAFSFVAYSLRPLFCNLLLPINAIYTVYYCLYYVVLIHLQYLRFENVFAIFLIFVFFDHQSV